MERRRFIGGIRVMWKKQEELWASTQLKTLFSHLGPVGPEALRAQVPLHGGNY